MTAEIALVIDKAIKNGDIRANLKGVGLGDSWISPVDSILTYAPYLLTLGQIDQQGYNLIMEVANKLKSAVDQNDMTTAMDLWDSIDFNINSLTHTDFYNVLTMAPSDSSNTLKKFGPIRSYNLKEELDLGIIMNRGVAPALNISREWVNQNDNVYNWLADDFLNPVTEVVEKLLNETDLTVAVYNGQLDLIVSTLGTLNWVKNLHFNGKDSWDATSKVGFAIDGYYQGYVKKHGNFALYWVDRAGHMVPRDNPSAMYYILKDVTNNFEV
ncbi:unnamed protein product [Psylliodes chrysocephalus]|uniref:Carboxypeptidase n=1 Tax=Psylliodes chrysocephalus TaxID=3402493 RepID=A0A9P0DC85_9CUCU|nr:unnamed protein product [Psylliodes chrysocephala]